MPIGHDSKEVKKKAPTIFIELVDQRDSGFVLDGTKGTQHEVRLKTPMVEFIPVRGYRLTKMVNPDTNIEEEQNEAIRWVKNSQVLSLAEQKRRGIEPPKNGMDKLIPVKKGNFSVTREGSHISLYDYLMQVFYNMSNTNRPDSAKGLYRVVELGKKEEQVNEKKLAIAEATKFLGSLCVKQNGKYKYDEDKINAICNMFTVYADTPAGKLNGLIAHAERDPVNFLNKVLKFEQTIVMEIGHALELGVVLFKGNTLVYGNKEKVIFHLGNGNLSQDKKINKSADLFGADENKAAYEEFRIELEAAKEKQFNN
jgi:hypothetical protein